MGMGAREGTGSWRTGVDTGLRSWSLRHRRETEKYTGTLSKKALNTRSRDLDSLLYSWGVIYVFEQGNYLRVVL